MTSVRKTGFATLLLLAFVLIPSTQFAQTAAAPLPTPEQRLRAYFYRGEGFAGGIMEGEQLTAKPGASLETRGWFLTQAIRDFDLGQTMPLYTMLNGMVKEAPENPWTLASQAAAANSPVDAALLCDAAIAKAGSNHDLLMVCAEIMAGTARSDKGAAATAFVEKHRSELESSADGLVALAGATEARMDAANWQQLTATMDALYQRALQLDPHNIRAAGHKAENLVYSEKKFKEGEAFLKDALTWGGDSFELHQVYWYLLGNIGLSKEEEARRIAEDMAAMLPKVLPGPFVFSLKHLQELAPARADAVAQLFLKLYPDTLTADMVRFNMATAQLAEYPNGADVPSKVRYEVARKLIDFMNRPQKKCWYAENKSANYLKDMLLDKGSADVPTELLLSAAKALRPDYAWAFALAVADRKEDLEQLEELAQSRVDGALLRARDRSAQWRLPRYAASESRDLWSELGGWQDVLGWVYLQQGRVKDADSRLIAAESLLNTEADPQNDPGVKFLDFNPQALMHLGRLYTAKGDYPKAEEYLGRSIAVEYQGEDEHPAIAAYKDLYLHKHGGADGLDAYMAAAYEKDRAVRKAAILQERIQQAKAIEPFKLTTVDGKMISSESLKGKYVVINFWGTWCGPCKSELGEVQKFYEKYKDNPNVAFLTIDAKDTTEEVKKFMAAKKYTYPVLMEGDYLNKVTVNGFPTTWFIDRNGNKIFEKNGSSKRLLEEFSWRVEGMMEMAAAAKTEGAKAQ